MFGGACECIACFDSRSELIQLARNIHQRIDHHLPVAPAAASVDAMPHAELAERRQRWVGVIKHLHKHAFELAGARSGGEDRGRPATAVAG